MFEMLIEMSILNSYYFLFKIINNVEFTFSFAILIVNHLVLILILNPYNYDDNVFKF
jgi:hypothetical protein